MKQADLGLDDVPLHRQFAGLGEMNRLPDRVSIPRFRHLLEQHELTPKILEAVNASLAAKGLMLKEGTEVDASLIAAPSSTKNSIGTHDPEMHQTRKGNQWCFGMKCHIGVEADSGLVLTVVVTAANVNDVPQAHALVHGEETDVFADAGYQGVEKREDTLDTRAHWHVALRPGLRRLLDTSDPKGAIAEETEHVKVRYRGLAKNTAQLHTLFALSNLWMAKRQLMATRA